MEIHGFDDLDNICKEFRIERSELDEYEVLFAQYGIDGWEGTSILFLTKEGKLFINDASHCSCYGLEGQFDPSETTKEAMMLQLTRGRIRSFNFKNFLEKFFGKP